MSVQRVIDNKKIGANIRLARVRKMMSQSELARLLGVTQTHMSNLERGRCGITVTMLNQLTNIWYPRYPPQGGSRTGNQRRQHRKLHTRRFN